MWRIPQAGTRGARQELIARLFVGMAERDAAEQHPCWPADRGRPTPSWKRRPGLLRTGVQAVVARQQHDGLNEAAEIDPLRRARTSVRSKRTGRPARRRIQNCAHIAASAPACPRAGHRSSGRAFRRPRSGARGKATSGRTDRSGIRCPRLSASSLIRGRINAFSASSRSPASASTRQGWILPAEGARAARSTISRTVFSGTGVGRNERQEYRLAIASRTCMRAALLQISICLGDIRAKANGLTDHVPRRRAKHQRCFA